MGNTQKWLKVIRVRIVLVGHSAVQQKRLVLELLYERCDRTLLCNQWKGSDIIYLEVKLVNKLSQVCWLKYLWQYLTLICRQKF